MMTTTDLHAFEKKLRAMMSRASDDVRQLEVESGQVGPGEGANLAADSSRSGDLSKDTTEEEVDFVLLQHEQNLLGECRAALDRIAAGTFGVCEECHGRIAKARLKVIPHTRYCLGCAQRQEHGSG